MNFSFFTPIVSSLAPGEHRGDRERCDGNGKSDIPAVEKLDAAQLPCPGEAKPCSILRECQFSSSPGFHPTSGSGISPRDQRAAIAPAISSADGARDTGNAKDEGIY